jgi:16S rRNA (guanine527-N7)-methyltransferase
MTDLAKYARELIGLRLSPAQLAAFEKYEQDLLEWNSRLNLTAIDHPEKVRVKHFLDSLTCLLAMRGTPIERVVDVGTGAGFPGIPLKIACPHIRLTLLESVGKKANFCRHAIKALQLADVEVVQERAEAAGLLPEHRERYDWAMARAVAGLPVLAEYLLPLVRVGGKALAMKGESGPAEAQAAERAMRLLGGRLQQLIPVTLPGVEDQRYLIVIQKQSATPDQYPRRVGVPSKHPL